MAYKRISPQPVVEGGTGIQSATAYSVLCAGTTSTGAFQNVSGVGTSGQVLKSNGPGMLPSWGTDASGSLFLISTQTASTSSAINFTSGISATYSNYFLQFHNVVAASSGAQLTLQLSPNGGSSYTASGYDSSYTAIDSAAGVGGLAATSSFILSLAGATDGLPTNTPISGQIWLYDVTVGITVAISGQSSYKGVGGSTRIYTGQIGGFRTGATVFNALRFIMDTGNITSGTFSLFGVAS